MDFEEALTAELEAIPGLNGKVMPSFMAAGKPVPYVMYESSFGLQDKTLDGYLKSKSVEGELSVVTGTYEEMKRLEAAVVGLLAGFTQRVIGDGGPYIQELTYEQPVELYESAAKLHRCVIPFEVHF